MDNSFEDRRAHSRTYRNFIMSFYEKGKTGVVHDTSQVNNVSKGGVSFSSTQALAQGTIVIVELKTPFIADSIQIEGIVLQCKEKIPDLIYEIRLQFQEVPEQVLTILDKIENYGKSEGG